MGEAIEDSCLFGHCQVDHLSSASQDPRSPVCVCVYSTFALHLGGCVHMYTKIMSIENKSIQYNDWACGHLSHHLGLNFYRDLSLMYTVAIATDSLFLHASVQTEVVHCQYLVSRMYPAILYTSNVGQCISFYTLSPLVILTT